MKIRLRYIIYKFIIYKEEKKDNVLVIKIDKRIMANRINVERRDKR